MSEAAPVCLLLHSHQSLLARLLAESLTHRGFVPCVEPDFAAVLQDEARLHPAAVLLEASAEALEWLSQQAPALRSKCLVLGDGDLGRFAELGCRIVSPADSLERIEQELRHIRPGEGEPRTLVLIVDDDPDTRATIREYFQTLGYDCSSAANGAEALVKIREELPQVVLLDLNMPEMGGLEFLRVVRQLNSNDFGIIVVTALHDPRLAARAVAAGAFDVVEKPINFQHLAYLVRIQISYREMRATQA